MTFIRFTIFQPSIYLNTTEQKWLYDRPKFKLDRSFFESAIFMIARLQNVILSTADSQLDL